MTKHTVFVHSSQNSWDPEPKFTVFSVDLSKHGSGNYLLVGEMEIDVPFEHPSKEAINKAQVDTLRKQQGEYQHAIDRLEEQIQSLLCIESIPF